MEHGLELIQSYPGNRWRFDFYNFLISWKYWKLELIDSVLKLINLYQASELILDFWIFHEIFDMCYLFGPRFWIIQA